MTFTPRPKQQEVLAYRGGKMGIAAVPGSGKTITLSYLAAQLVAEGGLADDQEVLVVTLVRSAVDHFARQVAQFVREHGLLPNLGYRVCTLHSLAHDIVRERPGLVGLSEDFAIVDEVEAGRILRDVVSSRLRARPELADDYLAPDLDQRTRERVLRDDWPLAMLDVGLAVTKLAKDRQLSPADLAELLAGGDQPLPLLKAAVEIYADYQRALAYRGAVDFDDLIRLALDALQLDADLLARLRHRWPYVLEDEAQDSSRLQERILRLLTEPEGNWVRVGDPNQAIYDTFTTADPRYLREFLREPGVQQRELPNSGRSTESIIALANRLMEWTRTEHPVPELRDALAPPRIEPTPPGDAQPNPPDAPERIHLSRRDQTADQEVKALVRSLQRCLEEQPDATVAVLTPRNTRGADVVAKLREAGLPYVELLRSTMSTRQAAERLGAVLGYLADPLSGARLAAAYRAWARPDEDEELDPGDLRRLRAGRLEALLAPGPEQESAATEDHSDEGDDRLALFLVLARRWLDASLLPIDQLVLTLAQDLFQEPAELALAHKLAAHLGRSAEANPTWRLPQLLREVQAIASNRRTFGGFSDDETGFDPESHRGKVVVSTVHKAKGLEWDRVYLLSVSNYDYPSAQAHDTYIGEKYFVRDRLNLQAEVEAQLRSVAFVAGNGAQADRPYHEGEATRTARLRYCAERLRLLYVGITRAKRELAITSNSGRRRDSQPAAPLVALSTWWEETNGQPTP